MWWDE
jgi:hypothetical protein